MDFFAGVWHGLDEAFFMFWETLWALVLGFALSGAVQAFVVAGARCGARSAITASGTLARRRSSV